FIQLIVRFSNTKFSTIIDNEAAAEALSAAALEAGLVITAYVDLDIGQGRTGIQPDRSAADLYRYCHQLKGLNIQGFHAYDGHVREVDFAKRKVECDRNFEPIAWLADQVRSEGLGNPTIIIGGSPSFPIYAQYPDVECSPGTFVLWDKGYGDTLPEQAFLPAAVLLCRVVSIPNPNQICVDLGYKAIASENPLDRRVYFLNAPELQPVGQSEEHLVLAAPTGQRWQLGDVLYALPIHVCPTVALYDRLTVID